MEKKAKRSLLVPQKIGVPIIRTGVVKLVEVKVTEVGAIRNSLGEHVKFITTLAVGWRTKVTLK